MIQEVGFGNGVARTTYQYDGLNRVRSTLTKSNQTNKFEFVYSYNDLNQRNRVQQSDGSYWIYEYDDLGQLTSAKHYHSNGEPVAGQLYEYTFDDIGNRESISSGGDSSGSNLNAATYSAVSDGRNLYQNRTVPGKIQVMGLAKDYAQVEVNSSVASRKGTYFRSEVSVSNGSSAVYQSIDVEVSYGGQQSTESGSTFIPKTPEAFT